MFRSQSSHNAFKSHTQEVNKTHKKGNLSLLTMKINETSYKNFTNVNVLSNAEKAEFKLSSIKKALQIKHEKVVFDNILNQLEIVTNESRFIKPRIELGQNERLKGFMDKNTSQFFEIPLKGNLSPVNISIEVHKGEIKAYTSFITPNPSEDFHEKRFEFEELKIFSRYNTFTEHKCYIGVYSTVDSRITIWYTFKKALELKASTKETYLKNIKQKLYQEEINKMLDNPALRKSFESKVKEILDKRRSKDRLNFIHMNKSLANSISHEVMSVQQKFKLDQKICQVKSRKLLITQEKGRRLKEKLMRREIREKEEEEARKVQLGIMKKERLEKKWLIIVFFIQASNEWRGLFFDLKRAKIHLQIQRMKAYIIQKKFRLKFPKNFTFEKRITALARNNLLFYHLSLERLVKVNASSLFIKCLKEAKNHSLIPNLFDAFSNKCSKISRAVRNYLRLNHQRLINLYMHWDKVANSLAAHLLAGKGRKKKNTHAAERLTTIPFSIKEKHVKHHLYQSKVNFIKAYRLGESPTTINYSFNDESLKKFIKSVALKHPKSTNSEKIH